MMLRHLNFLVHSIDKRNNKKKYFETEYSTTSKHLEKISFKMFLLIPLQTGLNCLNMSENFDIPSE